MKGKVLSFVTITAVLLFVTLECSAQDNLARVVKDHKPYTITVALKFSKKDRNLIVRAFSLLAEAEPNGHATGFLVGDGLVMTSYHVVSGELSAEKKKLLGFRADDDLQVKAYVNGCQARVVKIDVQSDLALLSVCASKPTQRPTFRGTPSRDEQLFMIAQPGEWKVVRRGSFSGLSSFAGNEYLAAKLEGQDGFSGSPVYDRDGELVGVFCLYDSIQGVALLSPGAKAQQFLAEYDTSTRSQP
jgi:S1-C subfamily serine protease